MGDRVPEPVRLRGDDPSPLTFDPVPLQKALVTIGPGVFCLPSTYRETGVHHGYRRLVLVSSGYYHPFAELFEDVLAAFAPVRDAWVSWIDAGGFIRPHRDGAPWRERWQVPIHAAGQFGGELVSRPVDGQAFPVTHFEPHWVLNDTDGPRVHLVIDRDVLLDRPPLPFELFPVPPVLEGAVDAASRS